MFHLPRVSRWVAVVLIALAIAACSLRGRLSIAQGSTPVDLGFVLSDWGGNKPGALHHVTIYRCVEDGAGFPGFGEVVWEAAAPSGAIPPFVGEFNYGRSLDNLATVRGPVPLTAGCYIAHASASFPDPRLAVLVFDISTDGTVSGRAEA